MEVLGGLVTFCLACGLGVVANVAIANEAFHRGVPWWLAALIGLLFTSVWNYARDFDDHVAAGAALQRTARAAADCGGCGAGWAEAATETRRRRLPEAVARFARHPLRGSILTAE